MLSSSKFWTTLIAITPLATSSLIKRGSSVIVGYRTVSPIVAQQYHDAGNTLTYNPSHSSDQLGSGAYISPIRGDWPMTDINWDCAILADSSTWNLANKAWLPPTADDGCTPLWWGAGEPNRNAYLNSIGGPGFTTSNTVLLSQIDGFNKLQILVPPTLMGKSGGLNFKVQCAAKTDQKGIDMISVYGDADWYSWVNVKGTPQHVNP